MKFTMNATSISMGVIIFVLSACESREEKAEMVCEMERGRGCLSSELRLF